MGGCAKTYLTIKGATLGVFVPVCLVVPRVRLYFWVRFQVLGKKFQVSYVFFLPPLFCQRIPALWMQNLGKNRLISASLG